MFNSLAQTTQPIIDHTRDPNYFSNLGLGIGGFIAFAIAFGMLIWLIHTTITNEDKDERGCAFVGIILWIMMVWWIIGLIVRIQYLS